MNANIRKTVVVCLLFVVTILVLTVYKVTAPRNLSVEQLREFGGRVFEEPFFLTDFNLLDHKGSEFSLQNFAGKWSLVYFGFTSCPDICPITLAELKQFYINLEQTPYQTDTQIVMVSVDPIRDTTQKLAEYVGSFHVDFIGLTGEYDEISGLAKQLFVAHSEPPQIANAQHEAHSSVADYTIDHSNNILLINPDGNYHGYLAPPHKDQNLITAYSDIRRKGY